MVVFMVAAVAALPLPVCSARWLVRYAAATARSRSKAALSAPSRSCTSQPAIFRLKMFSMKVVFLVSSHGIDAPRVLRCDQRDDLLCVLQRAEVLGDPAVEHARDGAAEQEGAEIVEL